MSQQIRPTADHICNKRLHWGGEVRSSTKPEMSFDKMK